MITAFADIGPSELMTVLIVLIVVVIPVAAFAFSRSGKGLEELGKGTFAIDREEPSRSRGAPPPQDPAEHEAEVRQMVEASAWRRRQRGEEAIDTDAEIERLLSGGEVPGDSGSGGGAEDPEMRQIREEIRQLIEANNERRGRRGEAPLDVDEEVERRLREWT